VQSKIIIFTSDRQAWLVRVDVSVNLFEGFQTRVPRFPIVVWHGELFLATEAVDRLFAIFVADRESGKRPAFRAASAATRFAVGLEEGGGGRRRKRDDDGGGGGAEQYWN
jgi:hypothetical protein